MSRKYKNNPLRTLARLGYWQSLYSRAKELKLKLFENESDFTKIQILFLQYLEIYNQLYIDLSLGEEYIDEKVIEDELRADAYLLYKRKQRKNVNTVSKDDVKDKMSIFSKIPKVIFTSKR